MALVLTCASLRGRRRGRSAGPLPLLAGVREAKGTDGSSQRGGRNTLESPVGHLKIAVLVARRILKHLIMRPAKDPEGQPPGVRLPTQSPANARINRSLPPPLFSPLKFHQL